MGCAPIDQSEDRSALHVPVGSRRKILMISKACLLCRRKPTSHELMRHVGSTLCVSATVSAMAYFAAVAAFSINAATSRACERKIAWLPGSSMTCDWARFAMNRSRSGLIIRSCVGITA
jgi:hypothetical protein